MSQILWLVPGLPLLGAIINALFGRRLPRRWVGIIAVAAVGAAFIISLILLASLLALPPEERAIHDTLYSWIKVGSFDVNVSFLLDPLSMVMLLVVTGVGSLIHIYSIGYMEHDEGLARFFSYLNLFVFSMLLLVLADNYLVMFVGWELVGLCSYLLIGFWYTREAARSAAVKAFVTNRIGDFGFTLGVILMFWTFGTLNFEAVFAKAPQMFNVGAPVITLMTLLLFIGATGKSAQIPLYVWLPDAMEGPTPVSALIHAATMVTAGVYMVARSHVLYELAPTTMQVVAIIGGATAFFAATVALVQTDLKRLLAYSTISQLGYMFLALGVGAFGDGIFQLATHAVFKALLFLGAGSVMHAMNDVIDMRRLGGLRKVMPITFATFVLGAAALAGVPFFSGFFSKDAILADLFESGNYGLWILGLGTAVLTAFYISRGVYLTFGGKARWKTNGAEPGEHIGQEFHPHESPRVMTIPLMILGVLAVVGGFIGLPAVIGADLFGQFLTPVFGESAFLASPTLEWMLITISTVMALLGILLAWWVYIRNPAIPARLVGYYPWVYQILSHKYYVDDVYDAVFARPARALANALWRDVDQRGIDGAANGLARLFGRAARGLRGLQSGFARGYALAMLIGIVIVIAVVIVRQ